MRFRTAAVAAAMTVASASLLDARQLTTGTRAAFDRYVALTEQRINGEVAGRAPFLWIDRLPAARRARTLADLRAGQVVSEPLETLDAGRSIDPGDGMIHHWVGTVLVRGATLDAVRAFVQDYDRYSTRFAPAIQRARLLSRAGDRFVVAMRTATSRVITVVLDGEYTIDYRAIGPTKMFTTSATSNIQEVEAAGEPGERRYPADARDAFLWRLRTYCAFEQRSEGVYEQCESISLTRSIPWIVRPLVKPFVTSIPRDTLELTLGAVARGVEADRSSPAAARILEPATRRPR